MTSSNPSASALSAAQISAILNAEVAKHVRDGYSVQHATGSSAVLQKAKRMGWFWNTILVLITGGLWLIYVIYRALNRKQLALTITVDETGKVSRS